MFNKHIIGLIGPLLILTSFHSLADAGHPSIRERIVEQVLKPCEGKKAGDKVLIVDHRGGKHAAICTLAAVPLRSNALPLISASLRSGGKRISFRTLRAIARKNVINLSQLRR